MATTLPFLRKDGLTTTTFKSGYILAGLCHRWGYPEQLATVTVETHRTIMYLEILLTCILKKSLSTAALNYMIHISILYTPSNLVYDRRITSHPLLMTSVDIQHLRSMTLYTNWLKRNTFLSSIARVDENIST
ncbi:hypothetical protein DPMN_067713 [Dreissena polymorpha]|uniref:Uncharacterized protein n=1 Tax=Dreissena polymorpha TaxID=45954 RepID=A0A9D3YZP7_DREPO|nr:hypothetical protein DPMN_067713 [Dreissena polymorpha]